MSGYFTGGCPTIRSSHKVGYTAVSGVLLKMCSRANLAGATELNSLEVAGRADVCLCQLLLLALLVPADQATVAQHVVEVIRLMVAVGVLDSDVVDLWVLDVHGGHGQSRT